MIERPILFTAPMVCAILDGRKTQTRRLIDPQPDHLQVHDWKRKRLYDAEHRMWCWKDLILENLWDFPGNEDRRALAARCPKGVAGDRLWIKENYRFREFSELMGMDDWRATVEYPADGASRYIYQCDAPADVGFWPGARIRAYEGKLRPSIFMYRWCSRQLLEIEEIRVERLQEISEADAVAEGLHVQIGDTKAGHMWNGSGYHDHVSFDRHGNRTYHVTMGNGICICHAGQKMKLSAARCAYRILWESINGAGSWSANPFVWVIRFRKVDHSASIK